MTLNAMFSKQSPFYFIVINARMLRRLASGSFSLANVLTDRCPAKPWAIWVRRECRIGPVKQVDLFLHSLEIDFQFPFHPMSQQAIRLEIDR